MRVLFLQFDYKETKFSRYWSKPIANIVFLIFDISEGMVFTLMVMIRNLEKITRLSIHR